MTSDSPQESAPRIAAARFIRKLRGESQAALIETPNGWFVVKWRENPLHRRILINEAVSSELMALLGIATPRWACIYVDHAFLADNPQIRIAGPHNVRKPVAPGLHFGSQFAWPRGDRLVYDSLPPALMNKVSNRWDFAKAFVFDVWTDNHDHRQAVFYRVPYRGFRASMIDHGYAFGFDGRAWRFRSSPVRSLFPGMLEVYNSARAARHYGFQMRAIRRFTRADLSSVIRRIPPEWIEDDTESLSRLCDELVYRARHLDELLAPALKYAGLKPGAC